MAVAALAGAVALSAAAAQAAPGMTIGIYDDAQILYGDPGRTFATLKQLRTQIVRVTLSWGGGGLAVARRRPASARNPNDPAYDWRAYDRAVQYANANQMRVLFSIWGTPRWANGGAGPSTAPRRPSDLRDFAYAAARRYSGVFRGRDGRLLPAVRYWLAWNEPNNPIFLAPQYRRARGGWEIASAAAYARICAAVYAGVHGAVSAGERVACGGTSPRGNNNPNSVRPSISPLAFLRALKRTAPRLSFDVYAHHPYYGSRSEEPGKEPPVASRGQPTTAVTLGNIGSLLTLLTQSYGPKKLWVTEYAYQTDPPDRLFGVSNAMQARYLQQSYAIARRNPRIEMMIWFLLRDELRLNNWQSGLVTTSGRRKPSFEAFRKLPR